MAVNEMSFTQISQVLNAITSQATGKATLASVDTSSFVAQATTALKTGMDPVFGAINQVLSRTIFSIRPYQRKFENLFVSETAFGNHIRKLAIVDSDAIDDDRYKLGADGTAIDQQIQLRAKPVQTNFYGSNVYENGYTIYKDQLECAFRSPDEFGSFISMIIQNNADKLEQYRENIARATLTNYVGGILAAGAGDRVVNVLERYNEDTGLDLTKEDILKPANYKGFVQYFYSLINTMSDLMTERSQKFQLNLTDAPVMRHTPKADQRLYMLSMTRHQNEMMALADTYHDTYLKQIGDVRTLNFWQNISDPSAINAVVSYTVEDGSIKALHVDTHGMGEDALQIQVLGVLFDKEAIGVASTQQWSNPAPFNARGGYTTYWFHETIKTWNDFTEKGIVFVI